MKKMLITLLVVAVAFATLGTVSLFADPGDSTDPIITLSYIEDVLIGEEGTEVVLRMGSAEIIATEKGGLADLTSGYDLPDGTAMPSNHHLIIPVGDGRGIEAQGTVIVLVKGDYTIE